MIFNFIRRAAATRSPLTGQKTSGTNHGLLGRSIVTRPTPAPRLVSTPRLYRTRRQPVKPAGGLVAQILKLFKG